MVKYLNKIKKYTTPLFMVCLACLMVALIAVSPDLVMVFKKIGFTGFTGYCDGSGKTLLQGVDGNIYSGPGGTTGLQNLWSSLFSVGTSIGSWLHETTIKGFTIVSPVIGTVAKWGSAVAASIYSTLTAPVVTVIGILINGMLDADALAVQAAMAVSIFVHDYAGRSLFEAKVCTYLAFITVFTIYGFIVINITKLLSFLYTKACRAYSYSTALLFSHPVLYQLLYWRYNSAILGLIAASQGQVLSLFIHYLDRFINDIWRPRNGWGVRLHPWIQYANPDLVVSNIGPIDNIGPINFFLACMLKHSHLYMNALEVTLYMHHLSIILPDIQDRWFRGYRVLQQSGPKLLLLTIRFKDRRILKEFAYTSLITCGGVTFCVLSLNFVAQLHAALGDPGIGALMRGYPFDMIKSIQWAEMPNFYFDPYFAGVPGWDFVNVPHNIHPALQFMHLSDFCHMLGQHNIIVQFPGGAWPGNEPINFPLYVPVEPEEPALLRENIVEALEEQEYYTPKGLLLIISTTITLLCCSLVKLSI